MATCPSCGSKRLGEGYRTAPLPMRLVGIRTLLCDNCNYEFRAFSPFPPKRPKSRRSKRKADVFNAGPQVDLKTLAPAGSDAAAQRQVASVQFDRTALPTYQTPKQINPQTGLPFDFEEDAPKTLTSALPAAPVAAPQPVVAPQPVAAPLVAAPGFAAPSFAAEKEVPAVLSDRQWRDQITAPPPSVSTEAPLMHLKEDLEERRRKTARGQRCPKCQSTEIQRRHRRSWEHFLLNLTAIRPFVCLSCRHEFYARRQAERQSLITEKEAEFVKDSCFNQAEEPEISAAKTE